MSVASFASAPEGVDREADDSQSRLPARGSTLSVFEWQTRKSNRTRKQTEKGKAFDKEIKERKCHSAYRKLKEQMNTIKPLLSRENLELHSFELIESERNKLDVLKEEFNHVHREYDELLETESEKEESYRWFDMRDREYTECRLRLCEKLQSLERVRNLERASALSKSVISSKSDSNSIKSSISQTIASAAAKTAKLKIEMEFLEQENKFKRMQLEKEIAIAKAEEEAFNSVLSRNNETVVNKDNDEKPIKPIKTETNNKKLSQDGCVNELTDVQTALKEIVNLQAKQTELSAQIMSQQRIVNLPIKEPPVFTGDPFDFPAFMTAFDTIIVANVSSDRDRLYFLDKYTQGKANDVVKGFMAMKSDRAYREARKLLEGRYGNPIHVAESYKSRLRNWPQIRDGDSTGLLEFSDFLIKCATAMTTMQSMAELNSTENLLKISTKLPSYSGVKWCRQAHESSLAGSPTSFSDFVKFVKQEAELANDPVFSPEAYMRERKKNSILSKPSLRGKSYSNKPPTTKQFHSKGPQPGHSLATGAKETATSTSKTSNSEQVCPVCNDKHNIANCATFTKHTVDERSDIIRKNKLCFRCFRNGHVSSQCSSKQVCAECQKPHHTLLHGAKPKTRAQATRREEAQTKANESANSNATSIETDTSSDQCQVVTNSRIIPVVIHHEENPHKIVKTYALLDDASDTTFITDGIQEQLEVPGVEVSLSLSTMLGCEVINVKKISGLVVESIDGSGRVALPKTYTRQRIPSRRNQVPTPEVADKWPHLREIKDNLLKLDESMEVGLLIGCNCPKAIKPKEVITGNSDDPYAVRTILGWSIVGPVSPSRPTCDDHVPVSHCTTACEVVTKSGDSISIVHRNQVKELMQPSVVNKMFELDFTEHKTQPSLSKEDRRFLQIAEDGIHQRDDGHYELPLPLKDSNVCLPNNREMALKRLQYLKGKFSRNSSFHNDYKTFMLKVIESGFAEKVQRPDPSNNRVWYIPHHGVYHPHKPDKIRVVFDCAAQYKNESLNNHLLQGPDLTNSLFGVLNRFRQEQVAFTCDIEGMFHQVKVDEQDRDLLRFFWWDDGDTSQEPQEYRMTVHLFGAASSPGCSNFALKQTAKDNEQDLGSAAAEMLLKNFYVDDGLKSVPSTEQAIKLIDDVTKMCAKGGFHLHKFVSNDKDVLKSIDESERADGVKKLDLDLDSLPLERTLGVQWCVESDCFKFSIVLQDKPCTRRGILSTVSSVFDPLGFVAPLMLEGKSILQELCRQDLDWDDSIPDDVKMRWEKWRRQLTQLEHFPIARCFKPNDLGRIVKTELHNFSDASTKGYGQCSYLRLVDEKGKIHCAFVTGKSRVAPLKPVTIPRLELTAAVCSLRVSQQLHQELEYTIDETFYWTDSKVVLGYVNNESRRFHVFVANRVQEIQDSTRPEQWKYVDTKQNPADEASRGLSAQELPLSTWIRGPSFLWENESRWPENRCDSNLSEDDPEVKKSVVMATSTQTKEFPTLLQRLEYFSDWYRAKKALALCIRYVNILRERVKKHQQKKPSESSQLCVNDLAVAERLIVKAVQSYSFAQEIADLRDKRSDTGKGDKAGKTTIKSSSSLSKLDPFIDENGLVRVGGRLKNSSQTDMIKFPVILPKRSFVTTLIIKHYHERVKHQGKGMTLNEVRENGFWIIGGSSVIGSIIASCVKCQRLRGSLQEQKMADLPKDRLEPAPPFTSCGVDYFGPFVVKVARKEHKRYGVIFTCMASRAVHLEVANSLDTDSFINAYRRFVSRRGPIRVLRSDQGTNFVGARRELREALAEMDKDRIKATLLQDNCDWVEFHMNVPSASHMGGVWERQIRTVRNVLSSLLQDNGAQLDDESLRTFMCEAEAIINCRPLTVDAITDPQSFGALTPNHLLTMKTRVLLAPPGSFQSVDMYCARRWRRVQHLVNEFWSRWRKEYLASLQQRQKWVRKRRNLEIGDIVIIKDENAARNCWQLARVSATYPSQDGLVRKVQVALADSCLDSKGKRRAPLRYLERPVQKLVLLMCREEPRPE